MGDFFTDPQGRVRPIRKGRKSGGLALAAGGLAVAIAASGGGLGGAASVGGAVDSALSQSVHAGAANSKTAARKGQYDEAWRRLGLKAVRKVAKHELTCAAHSYGEVREFFLRTPCRSLQRALLAIGDPYGNTVVVSIAWVGMPNSDSAQRLRALADADGTGNVSPMAGEVLELRGVRFTGEHYVSRRAAALVVIAEATAGRGQPDPGVLDGAAQVAVEFPPP